jgi:hypothetical protein
MQVWHPLSIAASVARPERSEGRGLVVSSNLFCTFHYAIRSVFFHALRYAQGVPPNSKLTLSAVKSTQNR